jgi:hypothetical protein
LYANQTKIGIISDVSQTIVNSVSVTVLYK